MSPKKKEILSFIGDKSNISKNILTQILKSVGIKLDVSQIDFIMITLIQKNNSLHNIPMKIFKEFIEEIFNSFQKIEKVEEKDKIIHSFEDSNKENKNSKEEIQYEKKNKQQNKLPSLNSSLPIIENKKPPPPPPKPDIKKKIINNYGKVEIIEEEKFMESVESYNDYLVKIKPKYEEDTSFSIVIFFKKNRIYEI